MSDELTEEQLKIRRLIYENEQLKAELRVRQEFKIDIDSLEQFCKDHYMMIALAALVGYYAISLIIDASKRRY